MVGRHLFKNQRQISVQATLVWANYQKMYETVGGSLLSANCNLNQKTDRFVNSQCLVNSSCLNWTPVKFAKDF